jgi:hypothetical protein
VNVDKSLRKLEFFIQIDVGIITFNLTEKAVGNHKLLGLGIQDQKIVVVKNGKEIKANIFGIVVNTYYGLDKIYGYV